MLKPLACCRVLLLLLPVHAFSQTTTLDSAAGPLRAEVLREGLSEPSAIEFLPDGRALVAERNQGRMSLVDFASGRDSEIRGLPEMPVFGDAGLHDVEKHPDFVANGWVYITYTEGEPHRSTLVLDRIRLDGARVRERERLLVADAWSESGSHYGGRIQFVGGHLYLTVGDRQHRDESQNRSNHVGSVLRLTADGGVPGDNPFVGDTGTRTPPRPEIWSYGHRNPQGLYLHPETGDLWSNEHGPRGGDELNLIVRGANYGWPVTGFGFEYSGGPIGMGITRQEGMEQPRWVYVPSIGPSDMIIYHGDAIPGWRGSFLLGAMSLTHLNRLVLRDGEVVLEERLGQGLLGRVRAVAQDAAGRVFVGNDSGQIWRISAP